MANSLVFRATASTSRNISRSRFQQFTLPSTSIHTRPSSTMPPVHTVPKLNDPSLLKTGVAYVNGEWVKAKSGKTFEVHGMRDSTLTITLCSRTVLQPLTLHFCQTPPLENSLAPPRNLTPLIPNVRSTLRRQHSLHFEQGLAASVRSF